MINIRGSLFETNSSAVHALVLNHHNYKKPKMITIRPISTFDQTYFMSLEDKVSYIVCFVLYNEHMRNGYDIEDIKHTYQYTNLAKHIKQLIGVEINIPSNFNLDLIEFNHQLIEDVYDVEEFIYTICKSTLKNSLAQILDEATCIDVFYD